MKPPYRVPTMVEIAAIPKNGFSAISTFSGCGGSSLGYRMAGFEMLYANEFVPAARDTYRANAAPYTYLDDRDIREVSAESVLNLIRMQPGELDLFDGSPPCASFSTAGKRQKGWGETKTYSDTTQRSDDLFFEFVRLVDGVRPKVFVAENVSGLVKGAAKGYFLEILAALKAAGGGYHVEAQLLDAQWLGVPQTRQRLIFVGVRNDLGLAPAHPKPLGYRYTIRDACPWIERAIHGNYSSSFAKRGSELSIDGPAPTIVAGVHGGGSHQVYVEAPPVEPDAWMIGKATGREWENLPPGGQSEKYFQLVRPLADAPAGTITASGGNAGLASVAHPNECRKFSIAELRRICAFPDDFILTGSYSQQYERLGRAVPPVMMAAIASTVRDEILSRLP